MAKKTPTAGMLPARGGPGNRDPEPRQEGEHLDPQADLVGREDLRAVPDDHRDPDEEGDLEHDLLEGRGPPDPEDPPDRGDVHPSPADAEAPGPAASREHE